MKPIGAAPKSAPPLFFIAMPNPNVALLRQLVVRDLKLRYRSTFLGFFWSLAKPGALILLFYCVFQLILNIRGGLSDFQPTANYGVFVAIGIITWTYVSGAILEGALAYLSHGHLIAKALFWRPVLPLACSLSHWVHYLFAQTVLVVGLGLLDYHDWGIELLGLIPLSLYELCLVAVGVWLLSWFQVLARDTLQFVELGLMVWFYGSPIVYPASIPLRSEALLAHFAPNHLSLLYLANPLAPILVLRQRILMSNHLADPALLSPSPAQLRDSLMLALFLLGLLLALTWRLNRKVNRQIADRL